MNQNYIPQPFERDQPNCSTCSCYSCPRDQSWYSQGGSTIDNSPSKEQQIFNDIRDQSLGNTGNTDLHCASIPRENNSENSFLKSENYSDISPTESVNGSTRVKRVKEALIRGRDYVKSKVSACKQKLPSLKESFGIKGGNLEKPVESLHQTRSESNSSLSDKTSIFKKVIFRFNSETDNEHSNEEKSASEEEITGCENLQGMPGLKEENDLSDSKPDLLKHADDENGQIIHVPGGKIYNYVIYLFI